MSRHRTYSHREVENICRTSEVLAARKSNNTGHTAERHIVLSNAQLVERYRHKYEDSDTPMVTAFALGPQAIAAIAEAINSGSGQAALAHLERDCTEGDRITIQVKVSPFSARYAFGREAGMTRNASMQGVTVVIERREGSVSYGLHLVTAFPAFEFRASSKGADKGDPGWRDRKNVWHDAPA